MKVLKKGTVPKPEPPWWVGLDLRCPNCGCEMKLEESDAWRIWRPRGRAQPHILCPTEGCGESLAVSTFTRIKTGGNTAHAK